MSYILVIVAVSVVGGTSMIYVPYPDQSQCERAASAVPYQPRPDLKAYNYAFCIPWKGWGG